MNFCPKCGTKNEDGTAVCRNAACGHRFASSALAMPKSGERRSAISRSSSSVSVVDSLSPVPGSTSKRYCAKCGSANDGGVAACRCCGAALATPRPLAESCVSGPTRPAASVRVSKTSRSPTEAKTRSIQSIAAIFRDWLGSKPASVRKFAELLPVWFRSKTALAVAGIAAVALFFVWVHSGDGKASSVPDSNSAVVGAKPWKAPWIRPGWKMPYLPPWAPAELLESVDFIMSTPSTGDAEAEYYRGKAREATRQIGLVEQRHAAHQTEAQYNMTLDGYSQISGNVFKKNGDLYKLDQNGNRYIISPLGNPIPVAK